MNNQKKIRASVERDLIEKELNADRFVRNANKGNSKIYIINHHNSPHTMLEVGRLREMSFRDAGGGTGEEVDIDEADTRERCYEQLVVYSTEDREIVGGYRFITGQRAFNSATGQFDLSTADYFDFSQQMKEDFLPYSIELGRSWVQPSYQPSVNPRKGLFALMNIWDGLGCLITRYPKIKYFFGKVTMYTNYNIEARDLLLSFIKHYFPNHLGLCHPKETLVAGFDNSLFKTNFVTEMGYQEGFKLLYKLLKEHGEFIPPLINIYMNLSSTMMAFGTAKNPDFGDVEETTILVTIADIHQEVIDRHVNYEG